MMDCAPSKLLSDIHYRLPHLSHVRFGGNFTDGSLSEILPGEVVVWHVWLSQELHVCMQGRLSGFIPDSLRIKGRQITNQYKLYALSHCVLKLTDIADRTSLPKCFINPIIERLSAGC